MPLDFLQPDNKVTYIRESLTDEEQLGMPNTNFYQDGKRAALIVIDMQKGYISPEPKPWVRNLSPDIRKITDTMVTNVQKLIKASRDSKIPILFTGDRYLPDGSDAGIRGEKFPQLSEYMRAGQKWVDIDQRVQPNDGEPIVWKQASSGFFGTHLTPMLIDRQIDTCILAGVATSGCVRATAVDAISSNFRTVVVEECVSDKNVWAHKASLFDIWRYIATVAPLEDVLSWLRDFRVSTEQD